MSVDLVLHINDLESLKNHIAVVEHYQPTFDGQPPKCVFIGICKLVGVYSLSYARTNKKWSELFANGGPIIVRIVHVTRNRAEAARVTQARLDAHSPRPESNILGAIMFKQRRIIRCINDGRIFRNQRDAAAQLGVNQASISLHMRGETMSVAGWTLEYIEGHMEKPPAQVPTLRKLQAE